MVITSLFMVYRTIKLKTTKPDYKHISITNTYLNNPNLNYFINSSNHKTLFKVPYI